MSEGKSITASVLADCVNGTLHGDGSIVIRTVDPLEKAGPESLSWVGAPKYLPKMASSKAGIVLVPQEGEVPSGVTFIRVDDPDLALNKVLTLLAPTRDEVPIGVHPTALVGQGSVVEGAAIGPHVVVGSDVKVGSGTILHAGVSVGLGSSIGRDCVLWPGVVVREHIAIGDRVIIHPNATIGADGFSYLQRGGHSVKVPQIGSVSIEDDVEIGANTTIDRARSGVTRIGRGTKIDNLVQIGHNCDIGEDCILISMVAIGGSTKVGNRCMISGQTAIKDHITIGNGVQIAVKSFVVKDVPDGAILRGQPAKDHIRYSREQVALSKLPDLLKTIKALEKRVADLEQQRSNS